MFLMISDSYFILYNLTYFSYFSTIVKCSSNGLASLKCYINLFIIIYYYVAAQSHTTAEQHIFTLPSLMDGHEGRTQSSMAITRTSIVMLTIINIFICIRKKCRYSLSLERECPIAPRLKMGIENSLSRLFGWNCQPTHFKKQFGHISNWWPYTQWD